MPRAMRRVLSLSKSCVAPLRSIGLVTLVGLVVLLPAPACSGTSEPTNVSIAASFVVPKGVLDKAEKLVVTVLEGTVTCDPAVGQTALPAGNAAAREVARKDLGKTGCATGVKFCGDITIEKSDALRVFSVTAKATDESTVAIGCASAKIEQDVLPLEITMFRYLAPPDCSDAVIQPTEQCVPKGSSDVTCDATCQSNELFLSVGSTLTHTETGGPGDKIDPFFLWPEGTGVPGRFFAFFTDRKVTGSNNVEVGLRGMRDDLSPITASENPALAAGEIYLPNETTFPSTAAARQQSAPAAAFVNNKFYVAFQDDTGTGATGQDIHLRSMDTSLVAEQGANPLGINGPSGAGEAGIQGVPAIASIPSGRLLVAWEDSGAGKIAARTLTPPGTLGNQIDVSTGNGNKGVSIAARADGWAIAWQNATGVKLRLVNDSNVPLGDVQSVTSKGTITERPRIAAIGDGRFAVVWAADGEIFVQRYDAKGAPIAGDAATPINDVVKDGVQTTPSIAATTAVSGSYVVAWLDAASGHVRARMLGGSGGFLFNHVNGQSTEFQASRVEGHTRATPVVVAGGSAPFVAIGWEDKSAPTAGIIARRFPLPTE